MYSPSQSRNRSTQRLLGVLLACSLAFVALPSTAGAVPAANQTQLTLDPLLTAGLKIANIKVVPKGAAGSGSGGLYFPVSNAVKVTNAFVGTTKHQGGFELQVGKSIKIGLRNLVVTTKAGNPVSGTVTAEPVIFGVAIGIPVPISTITIDSVQVRSPGVIARYRLKIDPAIATLINSTLGIRILAPNQSWATVETRLKR